MPRRGRTLLLRSADGGADRAIDLGEGHVQCQKGRPFLKGREGRYAHPGLCGSKGFLAIEAR